MQTKFFIASNEISGFLCEIDCFDLNFLNLAHANVKNYEKKNVFLFVFLEKKMDCNRLSPSQ